MIMKQISVVVPCYNEQENILLFYQTVTKIFRQLPEDFTYELLYIDDGSADRTLEQIRTLARQHKEVKYVSFSRNFGKEAALYAGLENAAGDYVAVMDVDLQDPPELLLDMLQTLETGEYACCAARRIDRKGEGIIRSFFSRMFYRVIRGISKTSIPDGARDFRMMTRTFVDQLLRLKEYNRFSKGLFEWVGFPVKWLEYENRQRQAGSTKFSFWKLLVYSVDGILSFSNLPAILSGVFGIFFCLIAFFFLIVIFVRALWFGDPVAGWPSTICIILLISGIQLFFLGLLGAYLAKVYAEVKQRPIYLCKETNIKQECEELKS